MDTELSQVSQLWLAIAEFLKGKFVLSFGNTSTRCYIYKVAEGTPLWEFGWLYYCGGSVVHFTVVPGMLKLGLDRSFCVSDPNFLVDFNDFLLYVDRQCALEFCNW